MSECLHNSLFSRPQICCESANWSNFREETLICKASGQAQEALEVLRHAQDLMERMGERHLAWDLYRPKGELTPSEDSKATAEAEAAFHQAIEIARSQSAKALRATRDDQPRGITARYQSPRGGARNASRNLQLVH